MIHVSDDDFGSRPGSAADDPPHLLLRALHRALLPGVLLPEAPRGLLTPATLGACTPFC